MRLFIGIKLPAKIRAYLYEVERLFPKQGLKFVNEGDIHLTIKFLGETEDINSINAALSKVSFKPFNARLYGLGVFPNERFIRVIHSPVTIGKEELLALHYSIDSALNKIGFLKDKNFTPHATIARVKSSSPEIIKIVNSIKFAQEFIVDSFTLFSSNLTSGGPIYSVVKEFSAEVDK